MPLINRLSSAGLAVDGQLDETQNLIPSTYNSAVTETTTASDVVQADRVWYGTVTETATASDTTVGAIQSYITTNLQVMLDAGNPSSYPGSGTTWTDINPNGYTPQNFTLVGTTYSSGSGGYLTFNGTSDYAYSTYSYAPNTTVNATTTTYACWVQTSTASGKKVFGFEYVQSGTGGSYSYDKQMWVGTNALVYIGAYNAGYRTVAGFPITDGTWHYLVFVYNAAAPSMSLYIDGIFCGSTPYVSGDQAIWLRIGSYQTSGWTNGVTGYWPGNMAIFQKYLSALTQANIRTNYAAWASRFGKSTGGLITSGLTLYLNANNYSGSGNWLDQSGNGYNMTLYNSPTFTSSATTPYFSFNGSNQYMNNASYTTPAQTSATSFTWIFLVNFTSGYNNYTALGNRGGGPPYNFMKITGYPNNLFQLYGGYSGFIASNSTVYNTWSTIGISKNGSTISVYASGGTGGGIYSTTQATNGGALPFYIGGDPTAGEYSNCKVAAVAVYNRALTTAEFVQMDYFLAGNYGA
jgi:hypothetical protein